MLNNTFLYFFLKMDWNWNRFFIIIHHFIAFSDYFPSILITEKPVQDILKFRAKVPIFPCGASSVSWGASLPKMVDLNRSLCVSGSGGRPGQKRDEWILRHSASRWDTIEEEGVSVAEASWGHVEAEGACWAEVLSGHPGVLHLVSEADSGVAEEAGISPILNTG